MEPLPKEKQTEIKFSIKEVLDQAIKYLPIASLIILVGGILRLYLYYNYFQIDITQYIELSEIIILFLSTLIQYTAAIVLLLPMVIYLKYARSLRQRFKKYKMWLFLLILVLAYWFLFQYKLFKLLSNEIQLSLFFFYFIAIILTDLKHKRFTLINIIGILFSLSFIYACLIAPIFNAARFKNNSLQHSSNVVMNDRIIKPFEKEYIIGKTKNYLFFFNDSTNLPEIYPISNLKFMTLNNLPSASTTGYVQTQNGTLNGESEAIIKKTESKPKERSFDDSFDSSFGNDTTKKN